MRDYVPCMYCGTPLNSDIAVTTYDEDGRPMFFCSERHKQQHFEEEANKGLYEE